MGRAENICTNLKLGRAVHSNDSDIFNFKQMTLVHRRPNVGHSPTGYRLAHCLLHIDDQSRDPQKGNPPYHNQPTSATDLSQI